MPDLTDLDIRILEYAERLELGKVKSVETTRAVLGMSPARYTQRLMHLVQLPEVVSDPRWTMMAKRIHGVMINAAQLRRARMFVPRSA